MILIAGSISSSQRIIKQVSGSRFPDRNCYTFVVNIVRTKHTTPNTTYLFLSSYHTTLSSTAGKCGVWHDSACNTHQAKSKLINRRGPTLKLLRINGHIELRIWRNKKNKPVLFYVDYPNIHLKYIFPKNVLRDASWYIMVKEAAMIGMIFGAKF